MALAPSKDRPQHGNVVIVSRYGEIVPLASRVGGTLFLTNAWYRRRGLYEGIASVADTLQAALRARPAAVIFDHTGDADEKIGPVVDALRARGVPAWGGGEVNDLLESNRAFALQVALKTGLNVPRTLFFDQGRGDPWTAVDLGAKQRIHRVRGHLEEAKRFVAAAGGEWVFKPFDTAAASLTFVAESAEQMAWRLDHMEEMGEIKPGQRFILQERIRGVEVSCEVLVANGEIAGPPNVTFETKKLMAGDCGPNSGAQTSTVAVLDGMRAQLARRTFGRDEFKAWLKNPTGPGGRAFPPYHAPLDGNFIVSEADHEPYLLEFTPRPGFNAIYAHMALLDGDLRKVFTDLAHGKDPNLLYKSRHFGYALRVQIPPAPYADKYVPPKGQEDGPGWRFAERLLEDATHVHVGGPVDDPDVWLTDAQAYKGGIRTAGVDGAVLETTARDPDMEECAERAERLFKEIDLPDAFARIGKDGVKRARDDAQTLVKWGFEIPGVEAGRDGDADKNEPAPPARLLIVEKRSA